MKRSISYETIYQYIWEDKRNGGTLWQLLRQSSKKRRKRYNAYDSRGRLTNKKSISERPLSVENKRFFGHWEIDTVFGKGSKHCIVTLVERKSKYLLIGKLPNKSTKELNQRVLKLILQNASRFKTITADNGTEFHQYQAIEELSGVTFYFATPYHSWERGLSENTNGLIRQYLPKNQSMESVTQHQCNYIAKQLNQRPRKCLRYKTPEEVFNEH
ncbi:hypothetical protein MAH1_31540 [Sessilibacter sp. MAH1]